MNIQELRNVTDAYLAPILSAEVLSDTVNCSKDANRVASLGPSKIAIKASKQGKKRIVIYRNPGFSSEELQLVKDFSEELFSIYDSTNEEYRNDLFSVLPARAIARHFGGVKAIKTILSQFEKWAARTYEGGAITSSIGIDPDAASIDISLAELFSHDFSAVLSNGFDTLLVATPDGHVSGAGQLILNNIGLEYAPYRLASIADWSSNGKMAFVLNRLGELLVFRDKKLVFVKRRGEWQYYSHEMYIRQIQPPQNRILRESIYQSCLDISYARTGGCILVVKSRSIDDVSTIISDDDRIDGLNPSIKTKIIRAMANRKFQDLDRRLRQELLALDGATVLTHDGNIISAGAIISVPSGSEGGGRRAAAIKGSLLGLGIKISEDGEINVFKNGSNLFNA